jgi:hypothetical protein
VTGAGFAEVLPMRHRIFNLLTGAAAAAITLLVFEGIDLSASAGLETVRHLCPFYPCWLLGGAADFTGLFGAIVGLMLILSLVYRR